MANTYMLMYIGILIRLVGGSLYYEGRVEVNYNGEWGTVCDDGWGYGEAYAVCKQLGFGTYGTPYISAQYGQGSGPILLDYVVCTGNELKLASCGYLSFGNTRGCTHFEDAGVRCSLQGIDH